MRQSERGMTLLEVIIAISILMLGVGFIIQGNGAIQKYRAQAQIRQQLLFYAAGQLEILLRGGQAIQGSELPAGEVPMNGFTVENPQGWTGFSQELNPPNPHLEQIGVTVTYGNQQVTLYTYRVK